MISNFLNISKRVLNDEEINLLSEGLNFCPSRHFDPFGTLLDIKFSRNLTLKKHYFEFPSEMGETSPGASDTGESPPSPSLFTEVCALQDLIELASESSPRLNDPTDMSNHIPFRMRSDFYPVASRGRDLNLFQKLIERDLTQLARSCQKSPMQDNL